MALILLGLGWNLGFFARTALRYAAAGRVPGQHRGTVDLGIALAGATVGIGSGLVVAAISLAVLGPPALWSPSPCSLPC